MFWGLLLWLGQPAAGLAQRVALVIGNSAYTADAALTNPRNDASDVSAALQRLGFRVTLLVDAGRAQMQQALVDFSRAAAASDQAVLFYAGHGIETRGENYLLPVDVDLRSENDPQFQALRLADAMDAVRLARRFGLVILDACRDDPFRRRMAGGQTRGVSRGLARIEPTASVLVAYAAREGTTALDGTGRNSPFTTALLNHLPRPGLEVMQMLREIRADVLDATRGQQNPSIYGQLGREQIFLADRGRLDSPPAVLPERPVAPPPLAIPGQPLRPIAPDPATGIEMRARAFADTYWENMSAENERTLAFIARAYSAQVQFYGNTRSSGFITDYKRQFLMRWPVRRYRSRPDELWASCEPGRQICILRGIVDWEARSEERRAFSSGVSNFTLEVSFAAGWPEIISENGSVLSRGAASTIR